MKPIVSAALVSALCAFSCGSLDRDESHSGFVTGTLGAVPSGFSVAETSGVGQPATWELLADPIATPGPRAEPRAVRVTTQNTGATYNLLLTDASYFADVLVEVAMRADSGVEDQGGGVVWRALDGNTYYLARWNPLEKNLRVYHVVDGKRTLLGSANVDGSADGWQTLAVRSRGDSIRVSFGGQPVLELNDKTISGGGRVGLWTKADACTTFRAFSVES